MAWITSASTIASLVLAIFGIGGYIYGIVTYLSKRASPIQHETTGSPQSATSRAKESSIPYKRLSWLEWTEIFAQGLVDTADFILSTLFPKEYDPEATVINKVGMCAGICAMGTLLAEFTLGLVIGIFLLALGMKDSAGAAVAVTTILLFMTFSFIYIYHVGLRVELNQLEQYREMQREQSVTQKRN